MHEGAGASPEYDDAHLAISKAHALYFVGFSFGRENVERLCAKKIPTTVRVCGSAYGMTEMEKTSAKTMLGRKHGAILIGQEALRFLREVERLDD